MTDERKYSIETEENAVYNYWSVRVNGIWCMDVRTEKLAKLVVKALERTPSLLDDLVDELEEDYSGAIGGEKGTK